MIDKKTSIRDLELAVVQAAMADHRGCAPETCGGSRLDPCPLANAINALMYACKECDAGGHTCPGDGNPIPHGAGDCGEHAEDAAKPDLDAEHLASLVVDCVQGGWLRYAQWHDGADVRITWQGGGIARVETVDNYGELIGEFDIAVSARRLPLPPPLGPENDGALQAELAAEQELIWVPRTWADVRPGDDVRLPGTDNTAHVQHAVHQHWHVDPRTGTAGWNPPQPLQWSGVQVELRPTTAPDQPAHLTMDPAKPVEIHLTQIEADAIELMGWSSRVGLITGEATG
jgi:hypothetical protein